MHQDAVSLVKTILDDQDEQEEPITITQVNLAIIRTSKWLQDLTVLRSNMLQKS